MSLIELKNKLKLRVLKFLSYKVPNLCSDFLNLSKKSRRDMGEVEFN